MIKTTHNESTSTTINLTNYELTSTTINITNYELTSTTINITHNASSYTMINSTHNESVSRWNLAFEDQDFGQSWINLVVGCILLMTTTLSIFTNGTCLYVFFIKKRSMLTRINSYIAVVCILAFTKAIIGYPMVISSSFAGYWLFGDAGCMYYGFLMTTFGLCTMFTLSLISVDRYLMVVLCRFNGLSINSFSISAISGSILLSVILAMGPLFGWNKYVREGLGTTCSPDLELTDASSRSYLTVLMIVAFILPLAVMAFCYWKIFSKVMETRKNLFPGNKHTDTPMSMNRKKNINLEVKLALTLVYIVVAFLLCWAPYSVTMIWAIVDAKSLTPLLISIPSLVTKLGSCFTPLVYMGRDRKMRRVVKENFECLRSETENIISNQKEIFRPAANNASNVNTLSTKAHTHTKTKSSCNPEKTSKRSKSSAKTGLGQTLNETVV